MLTDGLVIVDKPGGMTSHEVVARVRKLADTRKVGHAGTLDPMATGVLVVAVNAATRFLHHLVLTEKQYRATIRLGHSTVTDDADGDTIAVVATTAVTDADVVALLPRFTGTIRQIPSSVSAIKVDGKRAHALVRAGADVDLASRTVTVSRFRAVAFRRPESDVLDVDIEVECSSGTYVRALARDLGVALGVGGHLTALRRTRVGPFTIDLARPLAELSELAEPVHLALPDAVRLVMPVRDITEAAADQLSYGRFLDPAGLDGLYGVLAPDGRAVALMRDVAGRGRPVLVFHARGVTGRPVAVTAARRSGP